jgi:hypothetical protein
MSRSGSVHSAKLFGRFGRHPANVVKTIQPSTLLAGILPIREECPQEGFALRIKPKNEVSDTSVLWAKLCFPEEHPIGKRPNLEFGILIRQP